MVGPAFETGSIVVPFRARVEQLQRGLTQTTAAVNQFGDALTNKAREIDVAAAKMTTGVEGANRQLTTFAQRASNATARLLSLQLVVQRFGSRAGVGKFGREVSSATDAFIAFAAVVSILPSKVGLIVGGIVALGVAIAGLIGPSREERAELEKVNQELEVLRKRRQDLQFERFRVQNERTQRRAAGIFEPEGAEMENKALIEQERIIEQIAGARREIVLINKTAAAEAERLQTKFRSDFEGARKVLADAEDQVTDLSDDIKTLGENLRKSSTQAQAFAQALDVQALEDTFDGIKDGLVDIQKLTDSRAFEGLLTPAQQFEQSVTNARAEIDTLLRQQIVNENEVEKITKRIADNKSRERLEARTLEEAFQFQRLVADDERLLTRIAILQGNITKEIFEQNMLLEEQARRNARIEQGRKFAESFSQPFGQAIGDAVTNGILEGKKALEVVADVGRNLFANFLDSSIKGFQAGMIKAFDSIAGAGGEVLGNLFTGLAGIAGFFLSGGARGDADTAFAGVKSAVDSSQAVRGIVSGPQNIAIAQVGENLERALVPTNQILEAMLLEMIQVNVNTAGGGPGGGGGGAFPVAGAVPTP